jgi:hypothetical protein
MVWLYTYEGRVWSKFLVANIYMYICTYIYMYIYTYMYIYKYLSVESLSGLFSAKCIRKNVLRDDLKG